MSDTYDPKAIEPKWQERWEEDKLYRAEVDWSKQKHYALTMLPYPSGDLHIGHWFAMTPSDARARFMRMQGYNVMFPIGFDAFGLPAEQAAISRNIHPKEWTYANIERMRRQLRSMGAMWDWEREAVSCDPKYYHWTEWFFKRFFDHDLAYRGEALVNWSPTLQTVLANEQVIDGKDERTGQPVVQKLMKQWFFRITDYADELLDFEKIDWPDPVRIMQTNWIGRSEGAYVTFMTEQDDPIEVYTTRPDTLWGATFMVLAPEHRLVDEITTDAQRRQVRAYVEQAARATEIERSAEDREKTGVFTGGYAVNPVNGATIPIWIADYVLLSYGSGAIMAVPAHDERDFEFALKFGLSIIPVIARPDGQTKSFVVPGSMKDGFTGALDETGIGYEVKDGAVYVTMDVDQSEAYIGIAKEYLQAGYWNEVVGGRWVFIFADGVMPFDSVEAGKEILARCKELEPSVAKRQTVMEMLYEGCPWYRDVLYHAEYGDMINSGPFSGTPGIEQGEEGEEVHVAKKEVTRWLEEKGIGKGAVNYRMRDWLISRQRYWGAPIPMLYKADETIEPVPEEDLPVLLPDDVEFVPTGQSPLLFHEDFRHTTAADGSPARRETDTMDTFMCSSWYWYRYLSPGYGKGPFDPEEAAYWLPVDTYTGGAEHAVMHLLYARFFAKAMRDLDIFDAAIEIARAHGRDLPDDSFGEPMLQLRNQGQILGEERTGDYIMATGRRENNKLFATRVDVIDSDAVVPDAPNIVAGEVMSRVENILRIRAGGEAEGEMYVVEVLPDAVIDIPDIEGENNVNQLRHHLEIQRMSKSKGNVINPDELVEEYGADTVRAYLMFAFDWQKGGPWDSQGIRGVVRWLNDVWALFIGPVQTGGEADEADVRALRRKVHQTIKAVSDGLESFSFNTAIAALMGLRNTLQTVKQTPVADTAAWDEARNIYLRLMAPFTPHIAEEIWARSGYDYSVHTHSWPEYDEDVAAEEMIILVVQVRGKVRDRIEVPADITEEDAVETALASERVQKFTEGKEPRKVIYVADRGIVNIVV